VHPRSGPALRERSVRDDRPATAQWPPAYARYSIASPNWEEHLEFFSIKVPDGPLTSQLQHLKEGDEIIISKKPTGTLVLDDLNPGKHLYLLSTGTVWRRS
jgi:ferredoxin--NADP+ reductase